MWYKNNGFVILAFIHRCNNQFTNFYTRAKTDKLMFKVENLFGRSASIEFFFSIKITKSKKTDFLKVFYCFSRNNFSMKAIPKIHYGFYCISGQYIIHKASQACRNFNRTTDNWIYDLILAYLFKNSCNFFYSQAIYLKRILQKLCFLRTRYVQLIILLENSQILFIIIPGW